MILLVAAGLLLRSLEKMQAVSWGLQSCPGAGFQARRVTFMDERYNNPAAQRLFIRTLLEKLEAVPGFEAVGLGLDRIGQTWVHLPFIPEGANVCDPGRRSARPTIILAGLSAHDGDRIGAGPVPSPWRMTKRPEA